MQRRMGAGGERGSGPAGRPGCGARVLCLGEGSSKIAGGHIDSSLAGDSSPSKHQILDLPAPRREMQPYKDNNRKEIYLEGRGLPNDRYDEQRRRTSPPRRDLDQGRYEMRGNYHENRGYKGKWVPQRYRRSSRSPTHYRQAAMNDIDSEICGLIFMCNKRTSRRCLEYNVLGMPTARRSLANKVVPGMKLFLFEFESRELHGVFEATGIAQDNLEPRAFMDAEIKFPIHVPFRVAEKCAPLRECQFKEAIIGNYFEANRFKFNLSKVQVVKLLDLFLPKEAPPYDGLRRSLYAPHSQDGSPYADPRRPNYDEREGRVYRRDEWKDEQEFRKPAYVDSLGQHYQLDYSSTNRHYLEYREPVSTVTYEPDYKLGKYPGLSTVTGDYGYNSLVDGLPSASASLHQVGSSTGPYAAIPSKYETVVTGYTVGRTELNGLPEADRYWKTGAAPVQVTAEPYAIKQSVYARPPAFEGGIAANNGQRLLDPVEDVAHKKPLVSDVEYLQLPQVQLGHPLSAVKEPEYSTYGSEFRRAPAPYPEDGVDMLSNQAARYGTSNGVREEAAYPVRALGIPANGTGVSDRYLPPRDFSPRLPVPEPRYNGGPYRAGSYYKAERPGRYDFRGSTMNGYELQPVPKADYGVPGKYYADRGAYHRKLSVWERVSGFPGPRSRYHYDDFDRGYKRTREMSQESQDDEFNRTAGEADGSFAFDFKRRNKNTDSGGPSHPFTSTFPRKRRFVRPGQQYNDRPQTSGN